MGRPVGDGVGEDAACLDFAVGEDGDRAWGEEGVDCVVGDVVGLDADGVADAQSFGLGAQGVEGHVGLGRRCGRGPGRAGRGGRAAKASIRTSAPL